MSSANGLVGTGFASRHRLQHRAGLKGSVSRCKVTTPSSLSLTSKRVNTYYYPSILDRPGDKWSVC